MLIYPYLALIDTDEEKSKFQELYDEHRDLMFYRALKILNNHVLAEDALQEAFIRVTKNIHKVGEIKSPETIRFLLVITENAALTLLEQETRQHYDHEEFADDYHLQIPDSAFEHISRQVLADEILQLPKIYREVLYLHGFFDYTLPETARLLDISTETAKKRLQRGRAMLLKKTRGIYHG